MPRVLVVVSIPAKLAFTAIEDKIVKVAPRNCTGSGMGMERGGTRDLDFEFSRADHMRRTVARLRRAVAKIKGATIRKHDLTAVLAAHKA